jgi:uncharacterized protein YjbI with pentapeptide repeats
MEAIAEVNYFHTDMFDKDCSNISYAYCKFTGARLQGSNFSNDWFIGCDLFYTIFDNCDCSRVTIHNSNLYRTSFRNAILDNANFNVNPSGQKYIDFTKASMVGFQARDTNMSFSKLDDANLTNAIFYLCNLVGSSFVGAVMVNNNFICANLSKATIAATTVSKGIFINADMHDINLYNVKFEECNFQQAKLPFTKDTYTKYCNNNKLEFIDCTGLPN